MSDRTTFILGDWAVDPDRSALVRDGREKRVKPKSMDVLIALAQADGAVVSRQALFDTVWPNSEVTDDVLTHCIVELRKAFDDSAREPAYIETIPKKGFRLIPAVRYAESEVAELESGAPARRWKLAALTAVSAIVIAGLTIALLPDSDVDDRPNSVAVLPFVDMSEAKNQEYFADGMTEELINELVKLDGLVVTGRTSSFYFKGRNEDIRSIGEQLNVEHILEGSVRLSDDMLRITAQLVSVDDGFHLWSETYDRRQADIFLIQEEIAESVAKALSVELGVGEIAKYTGGTSNVEAHELVLRGNARYKEGTAEDARAAIASYRRAVELDPNYAIGWERLASAYLFARLVLGADYWADAQELALDSIERALELAPDSSIVLQTAAYLQIVLGDFFSARAYFERLEDADVRIPLSRSGTYIDMILKTGHVEEALRLQRANMLIDPKREENTLYMAHTLTAIGRPREALAILETSFLEGDARSGIAMEGLVAALTNGDIELISLWIERARDYSAPQYRGALATILSLVDDRAALSSYLRELYETSRDTDYIVSIFAGYVGADELVLGTFRRSEDLWAFWYPMFAPVRASDEFVELVTDIGLVRYWQAYGFNDYCSPTEAGEIRCD